MTETIPARSVRLAATEPVGGSVYCVEPGTLLLKAGGVWSARDEKALLHSLKKAMTFFRPQ